MTLNRLCSQNNFEVLVLSTLPPKRWHYSQVPAWFLHVRDHTPGSVHARIALYPRSWFSVHCFHAQIPLSYWGLRRRVNVCPLTLGTTAYICNSFRALWARCFTVQDNEARGKKRHAQGHMASQYKQVKTQVSGCLVQSSFCAEVVS